MKRIITYSIIALALLLSATPMADAKTKVRKHTSSKSNGIPSFKDFWCVGSNEKDKLNAMGVKVLYEKITPETDDDPKIEECIIGKDMIVTPGKDDLKFTATGPHPFCYYFSLAVSTEHIFYFKHKADRDKFHKQMMKAGMGREEWPKGYSDGWYYISHW